MHYVVGVVNVLSINKKFKAVLPLDRTTGALASVVGTIFFSSVSLATSWGLSHNPHRIFVFLLSSSFCRIFTQKLLWWFKDLVKYFFSVCSRTLLLLESRMDIIWWFIRNAESGASSQNCQTKICIFTRFPGDLSLH